MTIQDSRLTESDTDAMTAAVDEYAAKVRTELRQAGLPMRRLTSTEGEIARRLAYSAIGCSSYDLREVELEFVAGYVALH
jgi:hypothetical protein